LFQVEYLPPNLGTIAGFTYATIYILLEPFAGALLAPLLIAATALVNYLTSTYGAAVTYWAAGIHILAWVGQFIGHGVYERRKPALLDNVIQAVLLAPLFVWMEILFSLGYRPELKARLNKSIQEELAKLRKKEATKQ
jgi:2-hydroxy fatty acid dioxygenase